MAARLSARQHLTVRPIAHVVERSAQRWIIAIGPEERELRGASAGQLLPALFERLDGSLDVGELVRAVCRATGVSSPCVEQALCRLYDWGIVDDVAGYREVRGQPAGESAQEYYFALFSSRPVANCSALKRARVLVVGATGGAQRVEQALRRAGVGRVRVTPQPTAPGTWALVIGCGGGAAPALAWNRACVAARQPLLLGALRRGTVELGPLVLPGRAACAACVAEHRYGDPDPPQREPAGEPRDELLEELLAQWLAVEALRFVTPVLTPTVLGAVQRYEPNEQRLSAIEVPKRLRCPVCGALVGRSPLNPHPVGGERGFVL